MPQRCRPRSLRSSEGSRERRWASHRGTLLLLLALGPLLGAVGPAWARRVGSDRAALLQKAQPLLAQGLAALAAKDFATAQKTLGSAYRSAPLPEILILLARLALAEGRTVDAYDLYRRFLADPTRVPDDAAVRETEAILATPPPESGSLTIIGPPSALVMIDDRLVGVLPLPQPLLLAAGDHTLVLDLGGKRLDTPLQVLAGRLAEVRTGKSSGALLISLLPALLVFDEWPGVPADSLRPFVEAIERVAIGQQMGVMPAAVALRKGPDLQSCLATLPCQQQLAKRSSLDYGLRSRVVRAAEQATSLTATWTIELSLLHAEVTEPASTVATTCAACTADQAATRYRAALTELLTRGLPRQFGTTQLNSDPAGAAVTLAGRPVGKTPLRLSLWEGSYELTVTQPGYQPAAPSLAITGGKETPVSIPLVAVEVPVVEPAPSPASSPPLPHLRLPRPRWRLAAGGSLISFGAVLVTAGGIAGVTSNNPLYCAPDANPDPVPPDAVCRRLYENKTSGSITIGVGVAFGIAGTILMAIPGPWAN